VVLKDGLRAQVNPCKGAHTVYTLNKCAQVTTALTRVIDYGNYVNTYVRSTNYQDACLNGTCGGGTSPGCWRRTDTWWIESGPECAGAAANEYLGPCPSPSCPRRKCGCLVLSWWLGTSRAGFFQGDCVQDCQLARPWWPSHHGLST